MKTIGIIGCMSWESSAEYYRLINESIKSRLRPTHSAELVMYSMDFTAPRNSNWRNDGPSWRYF